MSIGSKVRGCTDPNRQFLTSLHRCVFTHSAVSDVLVARGAQVFVVKLHASGVLTANRGTIGGGLQTFVTADDWTVDVHK